MDTDFDTGQVLGDYELLAPTAKGGMAVVWVARKLQGSDRDLVAIKTLLQAEKQTLIALRDEAALTFAIRHPNVARLLATGEHAGAPYLVMEWIDGEPLDVIVRQAASRGGLPLDLSVDWVLQACRGLHAVHELRGEDGELRGVIHRDISPQNVMVTYDGTVKLVDFGIAKANDRGMQTQLGEIKGKVAYMSPEQVRGSALDRRVDVFAMGIVLYLLTTGRHPFKARTPAETIRRICFSGPPARPSSLARDYPAALEAIVMKALAADCEERHTTAEQLADELERVLADLPCRRNAAGYLRELLTECIASRRALLENAIVALEIKRDARNAPTVRPPRSCPSQAGPEQALAEIPKDADFANSFSSLRALILSSPLSTDRTPAQPAERNVVPASRPRRRAGLFAVAAALVAAILLPVAISREPAGRLELAQTSAGAPRTLVEKTLVTLRVNKGDSRKRTVLR